MYGLLRGRVAARGLAVLATLALSPLCDLRAHAQPGWVLSQQKISATQGGFTGELEDTDLFGKSVAGLGDLDGDGVGDLAVGALWDDGGAHGKNENAKRGAVWLLFLNSGGTVKSHQKISDKAGGFTGLIDDHDNFGRSLAALGDLDGDGVGDIAVGAPGDDDGGLQYGAVWILFLNSDGTVKAQQKISQTEGGFTGLLGEGDSFGTSVASLDDLDGDGVRELAVGTNSDDDGGFERGAVWLLFMNADGTVKSHQKISDTEGGFTGSLDNVDRFGRALASLGDLNDDGVGDLAVGAPGDDDGGNNRGAIWMLFLNSDGTVMFHQKISDTEGGFTGTLVNSDSFGACALLGDLDGDGVDDLAAGADSKVVYVLFLNPHGTVNGHQEIRENEGGFVGKPGDGFANSVALLGDLDGDSRSDLVVGAPNDDDGGGNVGSVWVLFLDGVAPPEDCPWDLTGDGVVDVHDLLVLVHNFGPCDGKKCPADFNGDGVVNARDLVELVHHFGPCP